MCADNLSELLALQVLLLPEKPAAVFPIVLKQLLGRDQGGDCCQLNCSFHSYHCAGHLNHGIQSSQAHCKPNKEVEKEGEADKS